MREFVDLRLYEDWAQRHLDPDLGDPLPLPHGAAPFVRRLVFETSDPRLHALKPEVIGPHGGLISVVDFRSYTPDELRSAEVLHLIISGQVYGSGEEFGTVYDDSYACPYCGHGRRQLTPLMLDLSKIERNVDMAITQARGEEIIVSESVARMMQSEKVAGCELVPVRQVGKKKVSRDWFQLRIVAESGPTIWPTRFARDYLRDDSGSGGFCVEHELTGLNLVSEVCLEHADLPQADVFRTKNRFGMRAGTLMPSPIVLISQRFYRALLRDAVRGFEVEVVQIGKSLRTDKTKET